VTEPTVHFSSESQKSLFIAGSMWIATKNHHKKMRGGHQKLLWQGKLPKDFKDVV